MTWLLDTMVVSETSRRRPDAQIAKWIVQQPDSEIAISVLTIGEIRKGIITARDPDHRRRLVEWFMREFEPGFSRAALPITVAIAYEWGHLTAEAATRRRVLPAVDGLIAATAGQKLLGSYAVEIREPCRKHVRMGLGIAVEARGRAVGLGAPG